MKKNTILLLIFSIAVIFNSCKKTKEKIDEITEFDIEYTTNLSIPTASIAVNATTTAVEFVTPNIPTRQASTFSAKKTAQNLVSEIKLLRFDLSASGTSANLDFLKSVSIYIKASNVSEQLIATKTTFANGLTAAGLELSDVNIKDYIFQENMQFKVVIIFDVSAITPDQTLKLDQTVHVKATLLN